jgi:hypothetical protein
MDIDTFKLCRMCRKELSDEEIKVCQDKKVPNVCENHLSKLLENIKKCAPLFQKMNLL